MGYADLFSIRRKVRRAFYSLAEREPADKAASEAVSLCLLRAASTKPLNSG